MNGSAAYHFYALDNFAANQPGETFALSVIDPAAGRLIGVRHLPGWRPGRTVAHPDGSRLYIPTATSHDSSAVSEG
ncbi:hypothetical protein ACFV9E_43880, partial [Streptomyces sp. NPDC059835]|uniref:hypothetical protein n=1 Tax=Streptomyces sp. NPDC059835 TaxID=3346967 RepID=UPI0036633AC7